MLPNQDYYRQAQEGLQGLPRAVSLASGEWSCWRFDSEAVDSASLVAQQLQAAVLLEGASRRGVFRIDLTGVYCP